MFDQPFIILFILIIVLLYLSFYFSRSEIISRKFNKSKYKNIAAFKDGEFGTIIGNIEQIETPLIAPLSGRKCAFYFVIVKEFAHNYGSKRKEWKNIIEKEAACKFIIKDNLDFAYVNSSKIYSHVLKDFEYFSNNDNDATEKLEQFLKDNNHSSKNILARNKNLKYIEGIIEIGDQIAVSGKMEWKNTAELGLNLSSANVLVVLPTEKEDEIYLSDATHIIRELKMKN